MNLHPDVKYQTITGIGGSFTNASACTYKKLNDSAKKEIISAYFDKENGLGYNFSRVSIGSNDFSEKDYVYVKDGDMNLESFSLDPDRETVIPFIKDALKLNPDIYILASPWSAPAYMKTNNSRIGGELRKDCYELWARYFRKYLDEYLKEGIKIWGVTVQNEPRHQQLWESCEYTEEEERIFLRDNLGPALEGSNTKIICYDHCKERLYERAKAMFNDDKANKYCNGIAYHWYSGDHFGEGELVNRIYPDKEIILSEGCHAIQKEGIPADNIEWGEAYAHELCGSFSHGLTAYTDFNLILNEKNGPYHNRDNRGCYANVAVYANTKTNEITYLSPFYYIGHFSKYVKRGAVRIGSSAWCQELEHVAFENPDGSIVVVMLNRTDKELQSTIRLDGENTAFTLKPHSIYTAIVNY